MADGLTKALTHANHEDFVAMTGLEDQLELLATIQKEEDLRESFQLSKNGPNTSISFGYYNATWSAQGCDQYLMNLIQDWPPCEYQTKKKVALAFRPFVKGIYTLWELYFVAQDPLKCEKKCSVRVVPHLDIVE